MMDNATLVNRWVGQSHSRRINFFQRSDGLYYYCQQVISQWDDAPPMWVDQAESGLFATLEDAVEDAKHLGKWLSDADASARSFSTNVFRPIGTNESHTISLLISQFLIENDDHILEVCQLDKYGSLLLHVDHITRDAAIRSVGMEYSDGIEGEESNVTVRLTLIGKRLHKLDIFKSDDSPLCLEPHEVDVSRLRFFDTVR